MSKKLTALALFTLILLFFLPNINAITSCTLNDPADSTYFDDGSRNLLVNVTAISDGGTNAGNITNVTITFGSVVFSNATANGTRTNVTAGATAIQADFTFTIASSSLSEGALTVYATCYNLTDATLPANSRNSTSRTYTVDLKNPAVTLSKPNNRQTVSVKGGGLVVFEYTPSDTNLGNATHYLNGQRYQSSTSGTTTTNITSGAINRFRSRYSSNNLSSQWIIEITDLSGRKTNSSEFTFKVFAQGSPEAQTVFVTPSGEVIKSPAKPKGKAITTPFFAGNTSGLLSNPFVWGTIIVAAVGLFIWYQNRKK